jgi:hypothetical protein
MDSLVAFCGAASNFPQRLASVGNFSLLPLPLLEIVVGKP